MPTALFTPVLTLLFGRLAINFYVAVRVLFMTKFMTGAWLMLRLVCQRVEFDRDFFLAMWRNHSAIEIYDPGPSAHQSKLESRIDAIFPF